MQLDKQIQGNLICSLTTLIPFPFQDVISDNHTELSDSPSTPTMVNIEAATAANTVAGLE